MSLTFQYCARTVAGKRVHGVMRAIDRGVALTTLRQRLLTPFVLEPVPGHTALHRLLVRGNARERLIFFRAYAALEHAGVDFSTAFGILIAQARSERFREALRAIRSDVEQHGEKLWAAMSRRPDDFTDLEVAMIAAAEEAGNRELVFNKLAEFLERDERLQNRLRAILLYPAIVFTGAVAVVVYVVLAVIPQLSRLFEAFEVKPSPLLSALTALSSHTHRWPLVSSIVVLLTGVAILGYRFARSSEGALLIDRARLRLPVLGPLVMKLSVARLARVLATLLESGVNQLRALDLAGPVVESRSLVSAVQLARDGIAAGTVAGLDEAFSLSGVFEPLLLGFIRVGTQAGDVPQMLTRVADYYEHEVESIFAGIPQLIQTIVTLALGLMVATIVYIVYVPLSTLSSSIH